VPATKIVETALPPPGPSAAQDVDRPPLPEPPPTPPAEDAPRVYGVTNGPARIVLRATADSWIQVKEDQNVLQTRILKPGEVYRVPDRPGITMRTGNAGGLAITVDGKPIPALGPEGRTRTVQLDPDRLAHLATVTE
jgi:cytoskeleton protein RodZ